MFTPNNVLLMIPVLVFLAMLGLGWLLSRTPPDKVSPVLMLGYCIGGLALLGDFYCAWYLAPPGISAIVDYLLLICGGAAGWLVGMLLSPDATEKPQFKEWGGAITTFLSGYVLAKFGDQFATFIREGKLTRIALGEALVPANAFLICMLIVFVTRKYWEPRKKGTGTVVPDTPLLSEGSGQEAQSVRRRESQNSEGAKSTGGEG